MSDSKNIFKVTDSNFDTEVLASSVPTLVDFWAEWCGPCRMLSPTVDKIADEYAGKLKVFKMNVDENPTTPSKYSIKGIPTLLIFKGGKLVDQIVGNQPKDTIAKSVNSHIS